MRCFHLILSGTTSITETDFGYTGQRDYSGDFGLMDSSGALLSGNRYMPFGETRTISGTTSISQIGFGYTGQRDYGDDFGLMDYKARFYSPALGRFTQPDTIVPQPGSSQAWNRYSYTLNNPVKYNDPTGHKAEEKKGEKCKDPAECDLEREKKGKNRDDNGEDIEFDTSDLFDPAYAEILKGIASGLDHVALGIDALLCVGLGTAMAIGFIEGASLGGVFGSYAGMPVVTGPLGAITAAVMIEVGSIPITQATDLLSSGADVAEFGAELINGDSYVKGSYSVNESGVTINNLSIGVGPKTQNNIFYNSIKGMDIEIVTSTVAQAFDMFYPVPPDETTVITLIE